MVEGRLLVVISLGPLNNNLVAGAPVVTTFANSYGLLPAARPHKSTQQLFTDWGPRREQPDRTLQSIP